MVTHVEAQETTFFKKLQNKADLDLRDNRGKHHCVALVLLGLILALLRHRDGSLSSIHRSMKNHHAKISLILGIDNERVVSRSHLPRLLAKINRKAFEELLFEFAQIELPEFGKQWFAGDGKELCGSIDKGDKRGEVLTQIVRHEDGLAIGHAFYNGTKESEKPCLKQLVEQTGIHKQNLTADALHLYPEMTEMIHQAGGTFLIGVKDNQKELHEDMKAHARSFKPTKEDKTVDKGHGRLDVREYACFDLSEEYFEDRWAKSGFSSLIQVKRSRTDLKTNKSSHETAYYISNGETEIAGQFFTAVRRHWSVEVNNNHRDVSLKEDSLRTKLKPVTTILASLRTLALKVLKLYNPKNMVALMQQFQDDFDFFIEQLQKIKFL
jgi:predicted transposase YbfD/YdcC